MAIDTNWYPNSRPQQRIMYANVAKKIGEYQAKYGLTAALVGRVTVMCETFIEGFDKLEQNRATMRQMTEWFDNILMGKPAGELVPSAPIFQTVVLDPTAFIGLVDEFRGFARFFKNNPVYDEADGMDLMIVAPDGESDDLDTITPELKILVTMNNSVEVTYTRGAMGGLELQYRRAGTTMWQMVDKSTETKIIFTPVLTTPDVPEKFELRGVYLLKNQRVGQWSPIYTVNVG